MICIRAFIISMNAKEKSFCCSAAAAELIVAIVRRLMMSMRANWANCEYLYEYKCYRSISNAFHHQFRSYERWRRDRSSMHLDSGKQKGNKSTEPKYGVSPSCRRSLIISICSIEPGRDLENETKTHIYGFHFQFYLIADRMCDIRVCLCFSFEPAIDSHNLVLRRIHDVTYLLNQWMR